MVSMDGIAPPASDRTLPTENLSRLRSTSPEQEQEPRSQDGRLERQLRQTLQRRRRSQSRNNGNKEFIRSPNITGEQRRKLKEAGQSQSKSTGRYGSRNIESEARPQTEEKEHRRRHRSSSRSVSGHRRRAARKDDPPGEVPEEALPVDRATTPRSRQDRKKATTRRNTFHQRKEFSKAVSLSPHALQHKSKAALSSLSSSHRSRHRKSNSISPTRKYNTSSNSPPDPLSKYLDSKEAENMTGVAPSVSLQSSGQQSNEDSDAPPPPTPLAPPSDNEEEEEPPPPPASTSIAAMLGPPTMTYSHAQQSFLSPQPTRQKRIFCSIQNPHVSPPELRSKRVNRTVADGIMPEKNEDWNDTEVVETMKNEASSSSLPRTTYKLHRSSLGDNMDPEREHSSQDAALHHSTKVVEEAPTSPMTRVPNPLRHSITIGEKILASPQLPFKKFANKMNRSSSNKKQITPSATSQTTLTGDTPFIESSNANFDNSCSSSTFSGCDDEVDTAPLSPRSKKRRSILSKARKGMSQMLHKSTRIITDKWRSLEDNDEAVQLSTEAIQIEEDDDDEEEEEDIDDKVLNPVDKDVIVNNYLDLGAQLDVSYQAALKGEEPRKEDQVVKLPPLPSLGGASTSKILGSPRKVRSKAAKVKDEKDGLHKESSRVQSRRHRQSQSESPTRPRGKATMDSPGALYLVSVGSRRRRRRCQSVSGEEDTIKRRNRSLERFKIKIRSKSASEKRDDVSLTALARHRKNRNQGKAKTRETEQAQKSPLPFSTQEEEDIMLPSVSPSELTTRSEDHVQTGTNNSKSTSTGSTQLNRSFHSVRSSVTSHSKSPRKTTSARRQLRGSQSSGARSTNRTDRSVPTRQGAVTVPSGISGSHVAKRREALQKIRDTKLDLLVDHNDDVTDETGDLTAGNHSSHTASSNITRSSTKRSPRHVRSSRNAEHSEKKFGEADVRNEVGR